MLTICIIITALLAIFGYSKKDKVKENFIDKGIVIDKELSKSTWVDCIRNRLKDADLNKYIFQDSIDFDKTEESDTVWAYRMGAMFTNCGFANALCNIDGVKRLSSVIYTLIQKSNAIDEGTIAKSTSVINKINLLYKKKKYKKIAEKINKMESEITKHYKTEKSRYITNAMRFGSWIEVLYIESNALIENYNSDLENLFVYTKGLQYFEKILDKKHIEFCEIDLLDKLSAITAEKKSLSEDSIKRINSEITRFRANYIK